VNKTAGQIQLNWLVYVPWFKNVANLTNSLIMHHLGVPLTFNQNVKCITLLTKFSKKILKWIYIQKIKEVQYKIGPFSF